METLENVLNNEDSTHWDLMEAFKALVLQKKWCNEEEFMDMLEEYPILLKCDKEWKEKKLNQ